MHGNGLLSGSIIHVSSHGNKAVRKLTMVAFIKVVASLINILASENNNLNVPNAL